MESVLLLPSGALVFSRCGERHAVGFLPTDGRFESAHPGSLRVGGERYARDRICDYDPAGPAGPGEVGRGAMEAARGAVLIGRIRRAGLGQVKAAARKDGRSAAQISRDVSILRAAALGGIERARLEHHCARGTVEALLERYGAYAQAILDDDSRRGRNDAAAGVRR